MYLAVWLVCCPEVLVYVEENSQVDRISRAKKKGKGKGFYNQEGCDSPTEEREAHDWKLMASHMIHRYTLEQRGSPRWWSMPSFLAAACSVAEIDAEKTEQDPYSRRGSIEHWDTQRSIWAYKKTCQIKPLATSRMHKRSACHQNWILVTMWGCCGFLLVNQKGRRTNGADTRGVLHIQYQIFSIICNKECDGKLLGRLLLAVDVSVGDKILMKRPYH
jgi:hypothetical protein